nr:hypothetical protein [Streptomyces sp. S063]
MITTAVALAAALVPAAVRAYVDTRARHQRRALAEVLREEEGHHLAEHDQ